MVNPTATDGPASSLAESSSPMVYRIHIERTGSGSRGDRWRVSHGGLELIASTRTPLFDASREFLANGVTGTLEMLHLGETIPAMRADIERAARLTVVENDRRGPRIGRWQPFDSSRCAAIAIADSAASAGA